MNRITLAIGDAEAVLELPSGVPVTIRYPGPVGSGEHLFRIWDALTTLIQDRRIMDQALQTAIDGLRADVTAQTTADASVKALIVGMSQQLTDALAKAAAAGATPDQLQALTDLRLQIVANTADLTTAVAANTPAAPATEPVPVDAAPVAAPVAAPAVDAPVEVPAPVATDPAVDSSAPSGTEVTPAAG